MNGRSVPTAESGFPVLRLTAIGNGRIDLQARKVGRWTREDAEKYLVRTGDFLIARGNGSIRLVGRGGLVACDDEVAFPDTMIRVRPETALLHPQFLRYQWDTPATRSQIERAAKTTAGIYKVNQGDLRGLGLALAPLPEQHRIVAEIEKHFTRLDDAVATLERVQAQLKRARASVLKAAVEGRLVPTEAELTRAVGPPYEPASALLERILEERRKRHEEAQVGAKRKKKYKEPVALETEGLPELPEGWVWACAGQCVDSQVGHAFKSHDFAEHGVNLLRGDNIGHGVLRWGERRRCIGTAAVDEFPHLMMSVADIVLAMDRPVISTGLKYAVVKALDLPALLVQRVVRLRPSVNTGYFLLNLQSPSFIAHLQAKAVGGGVPHISEGQVKAFPLPLPPLAEQRRIVAEVERRLSVLDALEQTVERTLTRSSRLRQSILKRAFEGKLVPQDPNDEPASELLARIQAGGAGGGT